MLSDQSTLADSTIQVRLQSILPGVDHTDSMQWDVPPGWTIDPSTVGFTLSGDVAVDTLFQVDLTGSLYPLPTISTKLPYAEGKVIEVSRNLEIARVVACHPVGGSVSVDGQLTEPCWQEAMSTLVDYEGNATEPDSTAVYFAYDESNLYVAVYCQESVMDSLAAQMTERDAAEYTEDAFGVMIQPQPPHGDVYQIYINPLGTVYDQHITRQTDAYWVGSPAWDGQYNIKTVLGDDFYSMEAALPLDQFNVSALTADKWRVNFRRKQFRMKMAYALQVPWSYDPTSFGVLIFR